jgi:hypothetical protein
MIMTLECMVFWTGAVRPRENAAAESANERRGLERVSKGLLFRWREIRRGNLNIQRAF